MGAFSHERLIMTVTFRCKRSGNCVSFTNENDIAGLRKHEGYEEVKDVPSFLQPTVEPVAPVKKRMGRPPRKVV